MLKRKALGHTVGATMLVGTILMTGGYAVVGAVLAVGALIFAIFHLWRTRQAPSHPQTDVPADGYAELGPRRSQDQEDHGFGD